MNFIKKLAANQQMNRAAKRIVRVIVTWIALLRPCPKADNIALTNSISYPSREVLQYWHSSLPATCIIVMLCLSESYVAKFMRSP